jgi:hypothetical protein
MGSPALKFCNIHIPDLALSTEKIHHEFGIIKDGEFIGIRYYDVDLETQQKLLQYILPLQYRHQFDVFLMVMNTDLILPHIDKGNILAINYYVQTSGATTIFFDTPGESAQPILGILGNDTIFDINMLTPEAHFQAVDNDIWMLDVQRPHSVVGASGQRVAYCLQSNHISFEQANDLYLRGEWNTRSENPTIP